ncbi:uncharacterized protein LOC131650921 [Vicia villosa]|uniref:uncharacterized protein LOC131650921 n=1 Tax=Vicia villosa TaxID=3911 RepID=UPI00273B3F14|nr:uncharacterized protein LOC131650921 [Vicia villosa]
MVYGWIDLNISKASEEMQFLDNKFFLFAGNIPEEVVRKRYKAVEEFLDNFNKKEGFLRLKSRQLWLSEGDCNTRFFHNSLRGRKGRNLLCSIESNGGRLEEVCEIKYHIFNHFKGFFKEAVSCRSEAKKLYMFSLSAADSLELEGSFSEREVKDAIWACDLMRFCSDFHSKGKFVKSITSSFLALIPKNKDPQNLSEYRPICFVGSLYKSIAKLLATRIKSVIGKLVSPNQTTFVSGRNMMNGVLLVNDILDWTKRKKELSPS